MVEALIVVRDFLVALALAWIGVTAEPAKRETVTTPAKPACSASEAAWCEHRRPSFDTRECG